MPQREIERFEAVRGRTLTLTASLTQAQLDWRPEPGRWSVGEVLDHIVLAEEVYRRPMAELIARARRGEATFVRDTARELNTSILFIPRPIFALFDLPVSLFTGFVPLPLRELAARSRLLPVQNPDVGTPRPERTRRALRDDLEASISLTKTLLLDNADLDYTRMIYANTLLGRNDIVALLRLMIRHEERHQEQLCDVMTAERFPPPTADDHA